MAHEAHFCACSINFDDLFDHCREIAFGKGAEIKIPELLLIVVGVPLHVLSRVPSASHVGVPDIVAGLGELWSECPLGFVSAIPPGDGV